MSEREDGGDAFPESYIGNDRPHEGIGGGMSLRDYFAAQVAGCMLIDAETYQGAAKLAYEFADALLEARKS